MISAETRYKTHNQKFLAIIEVLKTWRHYLESCKYKNKEGLERCQEGAIFSESAVYT